MPQTQLNSRLILRMAEASDRETIYRLRHEIYARELGQHEINTEAHLIDGLDAYNVYIVACAGAEIAGFISITPPGHGRYSIDKYLARGELPFAVDDALYEMRLLTVLPAYRNTRAAFLLMYAAVVWIWSHGGTRIVAIGRQEIRELYCRVGMEPHGREIRSGTVTFELMSAEVAALHRGWAQYTSLLRKLKPGVDWQLDLPYEPPDACFHGGASIEAVGDTFAALEKRSEVINADVLDAWFPPAPGVIAALQESLAWLARTSPPAHAEGLVRTIAKSRGVPDATILPGAGSSSLIFLVLREWLTSSSRVLVLDPSYGEYPHLFEKVIGCQVDRFSLAFENGYYPNLSELEQRVSQGYDLVVLVNPNSPTGRHVPRREVEVLLRRAPHRTRFWIDETYLEYAGSEQSLERFAARSTNVVVCKSLSKVYALSGLRAAYLCGPPTLIAPLQAISPPWALSLPAQVAAVKALQDPDYYAARYLETHALRDDLRDGLLKMGVSSVVPSVTNFLLCHLPPDGPDCETVLARCRDKNLFLRNPAITSPCLGTHALRIAVKDTATNARMLAILADVLNA